MHTALLPALAPVASPAEEAALTALLTEGEASVSDAPQFSPASAISLLLIVAAKEPKEPKKKTG
ncbi:hypothetical protein [Streptomyces sp. RerS4]|uniref:hypothetical protein n=1 Tax=Streptomyces sp. RerS4 TaxID=2942449 RepID=UPI00201C7B8F|nr:hypothetical protein [Streptomyces sp. RerS4]UQX04605.1 hypothetical protein M4D82_31895 [Streptomyces sp. RerS4]